MWSKNRARPNTAAGTNHVTRQIILWAAIVDIFTVTYVADTHIHCQVYIFYGTGETNRGYALLMTVKQETACTELPLFLFSLHHMVDQFIGISLGVILLDFVVKVTFS